MLFAMKENYAAKSITHTHTRTHTHKLGGEGCGPSQVVGRRKRMKECEIGRASCRERV